MPSVMFRFYGELNDFLPPRRRQVAFAREVASHASVKDAIEAQGPPHPEVELVLVNGAPVGLERPLADGDRVSVDPAWRTLTAPPSAGAAVAPRFLLDTHLGTLARDLRQLGFDAANDNHGEDEALARRSAAEGCVLLTRDLGLLKRGYVARGYVVRVTDPEEQLVELARRFDLCRALRPFSRCLRCNTPLETVAKRAMRRNCRLARAGATTPSGVVRGAAASTGAARTAPTCSSASRARRVAHHPPSPVAGAFASRRQAIGAPACWGAPLL